MTDLSTSIEGVVTRVTRSVVQINVTSLSLAPEPGKNEASAITREHGVGTGVVVTSDGYIVTNAHVVRGAQSIQVTLPGTMRGMHTTLPGKLIGVDSDLDLAVVKIERNGLPFLELANSDRVSQGQLVLAFGSPLGLTNSVSMGIVSNPDRQLSEDDFLSYIQTDTPINPGNSGGPLVDGLGRVIGINTFILSQSGGSEGIGFAIPSNVVRSVYRQLRERGHVHRGIIGVGAYSLNSVLVEGLGLKQHEGVLVADVAPDGPADKGGLKAGDVVVSVDQVAVRSARQFEQRVFRASAGTKLKLSVDRDGRRIPIEVEVLERQEDMDRLETMVNPRDNLIPNLGILGISLTKEVAALLPAVRMSWGVLVAARTQDFRAAPVNLQPGDIIHAANGTIVTDVQSLRDWLKTKQPGEAIVLQVERKGSLSYIGYRAE